MKIKCGFFKKIGYSFNPNMYSVLGFQSAGSVIGFVFLFTLITVCISMINLWILFGQAMQDVLRVGSLEEMIEVYVPEFTVADGELDLAEAVNLTISSVVVNIDDSVDEITMSDVEYLTKNSAFSVFFIGSKSNLVIYDVEAREYQEFRFSDLAVSEFTKNSLKNIVSEMTNWFVVIFGILWYIGAIMVHFLLAFFYFVIFLIVNLFLHRQVTGPQMYTLSVFAVVPSLCLSFLVDLLAITIPGEIMNPIYFIVTLLIGGFAIYSVNSENLSASNRAMNPYRLDDIEDALAPRGPSSENMEKLAENDLGGYAALASDGKGVQKKGGVFNNSGGRNIKIMGIDITKEEAEIIDKYVQGNLKDMAIAQLQSVTGLSYEQCREIAYDWYRYY